MNDFELIRQAVRTAAFDEALGTRLGLNPTDLACLEHVIAAPGLAPSRLAAVAGLTGGAITGVLDRLERAGFVTRRADPADRRRIAVEVVPERVEELGGLRAPLDASLRAVLAAGGAGQEVAIASFLREASNLVEAETARLRAEVRGGFVGTTYRAPLLGATRGRLAFTSGAPRLSANVAPLGPRAAARMIMETSASRLDLEPGAPDGALITATFEGPRPEVRSAGGQAEVRYRRQAAAVFATRAARITLSTEVPWSIALDGGITDLTGSLAGVRLERMEVEGGANHVDLVLPLPSGTVTVRFGGVAGSVRLRRPGGVPVAIRVAGGVSRLVVDGGHAEQVSGKRRYVGPGFDETPDRYEIEILGGASDVIVA